MALGTTQTAAAGMAATTEHPVSHVDWGALFAGAFVAAAIAYLLTTFGSAIGLSLTSPFEGRGASTPILLVGAGVWGLVVTVASYMAGGYVAGRMRRRVFDATDDEVNVRDSIHGLVVWAVASLVGAVLIAMTAAGAAKTGAQAVATAASGAAQGALLGAGAAAGTATGQQAGQGSDPLRGIIDRIMRQAGSSGGDPRVAAENADEVGRVVRDGLAQGDIAEEDRAYLASVVARSTGIAEPEARQRVDQGIESAKAAEQKARDAAEQARKVAIFAAFSLAASLLIGAAAAMWAATMGGRHRDQSIVLRGWLWR